MTRVGHLDGGSGPLSVGSQSSHLFSPFSNSCVAAFLPHINLLVFSASWTILRVHFPVLGLKLCILPLTSPTSTASVSEHLAVIAEGGSFRHLPAEVWSACFVCGQFSAALLKPPTLLICGTQRPRSPCWDTQDLGGLASEEYV